MSGEDDRLISGDNLERADSALRPTSLAEFVGQEMVVPIWRKPLSARREAGAMRWITHAASRSTRPWQDDIGTDCGG